MPGLNRNHVSLLAFTLLVSMTCVRLAHAEMDPTPLLQQALRFRVTIHTNPRTGFMVAAPHCRRASEGCDRRLLEFAHYLKDAGDRNGIDPWVLAAMAFRESGLNPFAVGSVGELGILQLRPYAKVSKDVRFVRDAWYRMRCKREPGACQREIVDRAAEMLARKLVLCGGDLDLALSAYNTGRCGGNRSYARRVRSEVAWLRGAVGLSRIEQLAEDARTVAVNEPAPNAEPAAAEVGTDEAPTAIAEPVGAGEQAEANGQAEPDETAEQRARDDQERNARAQATAQVEPRTRAVMRVTRRVSGR